MQHSQLNATPKQPAPVSTDVTPLGFDDGGWHGTLLQALRNLFHKHRDCLVAESPDEMKTWDKVLVEMANHSITQLGEGPFVVIHPFGREEVPHVDMAEGVVRTSAIELRFEGVGEDQFGWAGYVSVHRFPNRLRAVQLYQYADGGPPPALVIMLLDDYLDLRPEHEYMKEADNITVG